MTSGRRVVFLDRDGVVTVPEERDGKGYAVRSLDALAFYPDAVSSVGRLREAGYEVVIVTNQPDVANGLIDASTLAQINARVKEVTGVTRVRTCPHSRGDSCRCRKPRPGLLLDEAEEGVVDFTASWMVGDRDSDVEAGRSVGARTVFIDRGWAGEGGLGAHASATSLDEAVKVILEFAMNHDEAV